MRIREPQADERAPSMRVELRADDGQVFGQLTFHPLDGPLDGEDLRREVQGTDCDSVAASLALVAAVILDPTATDAAAVVEPVPAPCPVPAPIPTCTAPPRQEPAPAAPPRQEPLPPARSSGAARLSLGAALEAVAGLGPDATVVPRAFADLDFRRRWHPPACGYRWVAVTPRRPTPPPATRRLRSRTSGLSLA